MDSSSSLTKQSWSQNSSGVCVEASVVGHTCHRAGMGPVLEGYPLPGVGMKGVCHHIRLTVIFSEVIF